MKLSTAGGWADLARQSTLGVGDEAKYRAEADEILGRCMQFGSTLLAQYRWEDAKTFYQLALKIDPALDEAMEGYEKACDNAILNSGEDDANVVVYTVVRAAEIGEDGKTRFYRVEVFDKRKVSATHAINEPVCIVKRRYSHFDKLRKRVRESPSHPPTHPPTRICVSPQSPREPKPARAQLTAPSWCCGGPARQGVRQVSCQHRVPQEDDVPEGHLHRQEKQRRGGGKASSLQHMAQRVPADA